MVALPKPHHAPTLEAIDAAMEAGQQARFRPYLGMSAIGGPCERRLWLEFRWAFAPSFEAATLRRFEDGHRSEDIMAERLRLVDGIELLSLDPSTGRQFEFTDFGGHFAGHMDGAIVGLKEAPATWHVWEHKCTNEKKQASLAKLIRDKGEKAALEAWDATYYAQAVLYMHYSGMKRHYLTCSTPGTRDTISVRTEPNPKLAKQLIAKAERIIFADTIPDGVSENPSWYECKMCPMWDFCFGGRAATQVNLRTCIDSTPMPDGAWQHAGRVVTLDEQKQACPDHLMRPDLISYAKPVEADTENDRWIKYDNGMINHPAGVEAGRHRYTSREVAAATHPLPLDDNAEALRAQFEAEVIA